jgi:hypothetical protein
MCVGGVIGVLIVVSINSLGFPLTISFWVMFLVSLLPAIALIKKRL